MFFLLSSSQLSVASRTPDNGPCIKHMLSTTLQLRDIPVTAVYVVLFVYLFSYVTSVMHAGSRTFFAFYRFENFLNYQLKFKLRIVYKL